MIARRALHCAHATERAIARIAAGLEANRVRDMGKASMVLERLWARFDVLDALDMRDRSQVGFESEPESESKSKSESDREVHMSGLYCVYRNALDLSKVWRSAPMCFEAAQNLALELDDENGQSWCFIVRPANNLTWEAHMKK